MFDYFLYYAISITVLGGALGTYYIYYPRKVNNMASNLSWNISRMYVDCIDASDSLGKIINNLNEICDESGYLADSEGDSDESTYVEEDQISLISYSNKTEACFLSDNIDDAIVEEVLSKSPSIIFIKRKLGDKIFYKRTIKPIKDAIFIPFQDNPFIQVEYIVKEDGEDKIHDIHQYLNGFYINGNTILDREFLEWYLSYYYDMNCAKEYILRIIDKDIKMFDMSSDKKVVLNDNAYVVTDIPTINISGETES
tara:strand:- start:6465 stop:7226 length:762 start_codon:yes stop_codon:yes gene_type:complete